jgi:anaerobic dimethyl sulfoxide reductase subunit A
MDYSGSVSPLQGMRKAARRFFSFFGGCATWWGITSYEAGLFSSLATFGTAFTGTTRDNFLHSKLIILWGFDPVVTRFGPDTLYHLGQAKSRSQDFAWIPVEPYGKGARRGIAVRPAQTRHTSP